MPRRSGPFQLPQAASLQKPTGLFAHRSRPRNDGGCTPRYDGWISWPLLKTESFNAKVKAFRVQFRGVRDIPFFIFRLTKIFAKCRAVSANTPDSCSKPVARATPTGSLRMLCRTDDAETFYVEPNIASWHYKCPMIIRFV